MHILRPAAIALLVLLVQARHSHCADRLTLDDAKTRLQQAVDEELARGVVPAVSVAWVVDGRTVHAAGYGKADPQHGLPATADTIYRAGSISKLFNALAAAQLVEQGKLDLDAPIERALSDFRIANPFEGSAPITARQLLCHRSGMIRECPLGGYLDPRQPSIAATVGSVAGCALVNPPNTKTRYSNVGPTIVGRAVEVQAGVSYAEYQRQHILGPLGMASSAWTMNDKLRPRLAKAVMRVARGDGSYAIEPAPEFELGTLPAGNLYTTAADLARFASFVMGGNASEAPPAILKRESLDEMCTVQLTKDPAGFGLGFFVGTYRDHKTVQHTGAVYGFSTSMVVLRDEKIAAIVLASADLAGAGVRRLSERSLDLLLEHVRGEAPPQAAATVEVDSTTLAEVAGDYESPSYWARIVAEGNVLRGDLSGQRVELAATGPLKFVASGRLMHRAPIEFERDADGRIHAFKGAGQRFERVDPSKDTAPARWQELAGVYGPRFIPLVVSIRNGHLYATVENEYDYRLKPLNSVTFELPPGMYSDEQAVFQTDADGKPLGVVFANQYLKRRDD